MAAVTSSRLSPLKNMSDDDDDYTRDTTSPEIDDERSDHNPSSFTIDNVLKKERDALHDDDSCCSDDTVLSVGNEIQYPESNINFRHLQSHLNAISQLSHNIAQPLILRPNPAPPMMFLTQQQMFQNPFIQHRTEKDERDGLKFSIDNILKADFGRRITDPIRRRVKKPVPIRKDRDIVEKEVHDRYRESDEKKDDSKEEAGSSTDSSMVWPAWVYCTRYSDRPSSGRSPRTRKPKKPSGESSDEKRPRTAFSGPQLARLKHEFAENRYLTERRRQSLAAELGLAEAQIKIWFQNKRAKIKKASGQRNPLALQLMAQGLYNHSTVPLTKEEEELEMKAREREQQGLQ